MSFHPLRSAINDPPTRLTSSHWAAYCDGASRGNPGPSSYGVVLCDPAGRVFKEFKETLGIGTNQEAEYHALLRALKELLVAGAADATVFTDSEFVVKQFTGVYRAKDPRMKNFLAQAKQLAARFVEVRLTHVARSSHAHNRRADALANEALDAKRIF